MDAPTRETFYQELLEDHSRNPRTVILSTHHVSEVEHLFEEVVILHQGSILLQESMDQVLECGAMVTGDAQAVDEFTAGCRCSIRSGWAGRSGRWCTGSFRRISFWKRDGGGLKSDPFRFSICLFI